MKTLVFSLALVLIASLGRAQEIQLSEAKVEFTPRILERGDQFIVNVEENYPGEFEQDPLEFVRRNFDIAGFIQHVKRDEIESYYVNFRSRKGELNAEFDKEGKLLKTSQKFKNISVPSEISHQLYRDYKGWKMTKNVHIASGKDDRLDRNYYLITMRNGKQKKNLRIDYKASGDYVVAQL